MKNKQSIKILEKLINYNFKIAGKLLIDKNNKVNYRVIDQEFKSQNQEQVYAWVSDEKILYIGMASKGIQKRLSEHRGGWRGGSSTGILKETQIRKKLEEGHQIYIYGRTCDYFLQEVKILDKSQKCRFSLVEQEEGALIKEFKPLWNTVGVK